MILGQWTQSVTIAGVTARVRDTAITEQSDSRIARVQFSIEDQPDNTAAFDAAVTGAEVVVVQTADGRTRTNQAEIYNVRTQRGRNWTQKHVEARGFEVKAKGVRFQDEWAATAASTVITEAWDRHGTELGFALDIDANTTLVDISASYDSLYDLMQEVCQRVNWAWSISDDTVHFFDPLAVVGPAIDQGNNQVEADTIDVQRSIEQLANICRVQGYIYRRRNIRTETTVLQCRFAYPAKELEPHEDSAWEFVGNPRIEQDFKDIDREVVMRDDGWLEFNPPIDPSVENEGVSLTSPAVVIFSVEYRRKVWFRKQDTASVSEFGPRENMPLYGDGGMGESECDALLTEHLARWSQPTIQVGLAPLEFGHVPDSLCALTLTDPAVSGSLYVVEVRRTTRGPELHIEVEMASPDTVLDG